MEHEVLKRAAVWHAESGAVGTAACNCGWSVEVGPYGSMIRCDLALETSIALHLERTREGGGLARWPRPA